MTLRRLNSSSTNQQPAAGRSAMMLFVALLLVSPAFADQQTDVLLARAWPYVPFNSLHDLGAGVAIVFSPDLSVKGNCRFYSSLGFTCFDSPEWTQVLRGIRDHNYDNPERPIRTVMLETHGTNGNGLKLQRSYAPNADRSYISIGALQERLEQYGVEYVILSACNSGRLMRSSIYRNLDPNPGDKLFLPATCGIIGTSYGWDSSRSRVTVLAPLSSHIEMTVVGSMSDLSTRTRKAVLRASWLARVAAPKDFAISDLMMEILTHDRELKLGVATEVEQLSRERSAEEVSEALFKRFVKHLDVLAERDLTIAGSRKAQ